MKPINKNNDTIPEECNDLTIGKWTFDVFISSSGDLGFTVYDPRNKERCVDIFIYDDMEVRCG